MTEPIGDPGASRPEIPNVVSLRGAPLPGSREPDAEAVARLEELLVEARAGQLHGIAYTTVCDDVVSTGWAGHGSGHRMLAGAVLLQYRLAAWLIIKD